MAKRVDVAYFIGVQDFGPGHQFNLWNLLIPVRTADKQHYHPVESTMVEQTLQQLVAGIVFPPKPKVGDKAYAMV